MSSLHCSVFSAQCPVLSVQCQVSSVQCQLSHMDFASREVACSLSQCAVRQNMHIYVRICMYVRTYVCMCHMCRIARVKNFKIECNMSGVGAKFQDLVQHVKSRCNVLSGIAGHSRNSGVRTYVRVRTFGIPCYRGAGWEPQEHNYHTYKAASNICFKVEARRQ